MSEADWTPSPLVEQEAALRRRRVSRHDWIALTTGPLALVGAIALGIALSLAFLPSGLATVVSILLVVLAFWVAGRVDRRRAALVEATEENDRLVREEFGGGPGWFVDLIVHQGAAATGRDRGMMWVEDGRLIFAGHRTSFCLSPDGVREVRRQGKVLGLRHGMRMALEGGRAVSVECPDGDSFATAAEATNALFDAVRYWTSGPRGRGGGQLPPARLGPGAPAPGWLLRKAVSSTAFYAFFTWLAWGVLTQGASVIVLLFPALWGTVFNTWHPLAYWRAWRDRRRLERAQWKT